MDQKDRGRRGEHGLTAHGGEVDEHAGADDGEEGDRHRPAQPAEDQTRLFRGYSAQHQDVQDEPDAAEGQSRAGGCQYGGVIRVVVVVGLVFVFRQHCDDDASDGGEALQAMADEQKNADRDGAAAQVEAAAARSPRHGAT